MGGALGLVAVGFYGGLFQAGVGIPMMVLLVGAMRLDLVKANAAKAALVTVYTTLILLVFGSEGQIAWMDGAVLAAGGSSGGARRERGGVAGGAVHPAAGVPRVDRGGGQRAGLIADSAVVQS
ncbi:MAG: sulfite exporter TauE/SafE family protein [Myxococcales bacterium]|nr:sulfite exporter TauE/SafE family protein [Myxococcales bacterium]